MKRTALALCLLLFVSVLFVDCASAQAQGFLVTIENPAEGEIITASSVNLNFSVSNYGILRHPVRSINYTVYLDGNLCRKETQAVNLTKAGFLYYTNLTLTNLTQGRHEIGVDVTIMADMTAAAPFHTPIGKVDDKSATVDFFVYQGILPQVSISGLDVYANRTTFNITANEFDSTVSYSLDGGANVTLPQNESALLQDLYAYNVTLLGLPGGIHTLAAYVKDVFNHTAVAEETFTVLPLSIMVLIVVIAVTGIVCAAGLFVYFRKRKARSRNIAI